MSNLEEFNEVHEELKKVLDSTEGLIDNFKLLNILISVYLPSIAKSLAIIADKMSEEEKED